MYALSSILIISKILIQGNDIFYQNKDAQSFCER